VFTGLAALAVLLQGLWAGIFLEHDGQRDASGHWIDIHARGGEVALVLAAIAMLIALVKLRFRHELLLGSVVLVVLLVVESYLGGLIRDHGKDTLTAVHVPLAMAIMALAVWLPLQARQRAAHDRRGPTAPGSRRSPTPARSNSR
jgi:lipopolysaccharide export LptBFGC system permease protein LptF